SLPYFFEENLSASDKEFFLSENTSKHCVQVLRMSEREKLILTNGKGLRAFAEIIRPHKKQTAVAIIGIEQIPIMPQKTAIGISLLKNTSRFEWFLEKATELGVNAIYPLLCSRTEKQHFRFDRMKGILIAAMLQSQQVWLPEFYEPQQFDKFLSSPLAGNWFIAHCEEGEKQLLSEVAKNDIDAGVLIGPEGDFSPEEIQKALAHGMIPVSLGLTRLRTETAGIVAATLLTLR
ncbi:MAG TPA: RsmE family RNA methyltransferase, partial [Parasegetibacter sp.]